MTADEWIAAFAAEIGAPPPTATEIETLLALAARAAHSSERTAAPLACWLAGRAGLTPETALTRAEAVSGDR